MKAENVEIRGFPTVSTSLKQDAQLSHRDRTAGLRYSFSLILELGDNISRTL